MQREFPVHASSATGLLEAQPLPLGKGPSISRLRKAATEEQLVQRILVPTDFSGGSTKAVWRAIALARQCGAQITVLHVIDISRQPSAGESGCAEELVNRLWAEGSAQMGQLACSLSGHAEVRTALEEGLPWEQIVERSRDFDLLVLGTGRIPSRWKLFSAHTIQRAIENAACPVMVVRESD